jgi:GntR family transcriptional regulator, transcriptional repressor for pyruvate dehydrogenase complex
VGIIDLSSPTLGAIRRTSAVDTVRARIALAVELGLVRPGERLPPTDETAVAFGVSEITVRRGYRMLQDDGVLVRRRGHTGGTFVADDPAHVPVVARAEYRADATRVHGLIDQRAVLESGLARLGAHARSDDDLATMAQQVERMAVAANWAEFRELDAAFHARMAAASALPAGAELHARVSTELYAYFLPYPLDYLRASNAEHGLLVDALRAGDGDAAAGLAYDHVRELHDSMYVGLGG